MSESPKDAKTIFLAALDVADGTERAAFVARSCGGDAALKRRVDDLLRAYGQPDGPLDKLAAAMASTQIAEPIREQVGATIGPYKLMEQIGEGGFGLVFVAEQQQPIRRKVALKIIKPGMDSRDVIARFEAERQALALMDHPNIARVLDAGTTQSGRPYFVMELVRGIPITDYCDQNQLTPRERLTLFVDVCNAVQHAHTKGIIHRDVKPSNVLVTLHDDRPVVKVIDFGVAKALFQPLTDKTIYTRYAQMIGTPLYMSPEQAQMSGLDVDTRSDIYSLGVLLYELLTGSTPLDKHRIALAAYDEMLKLIREEEAPKPSVRLSQSTDTLPSIAALRKTEPSKLPKMFDGDVDWIAMKALEKDRTRRYETANAFAADVLRYLNDEPVEASPPSAAYRLRKFARKHRTPVFVVTSIATLLVIGIAITTRSMVLARRSEQAALKAEQEARAHRQSAERSEQKSLDALHRATLERDLKTKALDQVSAERDHAERELAIGLLRPIGFGSGHTPESFGQPADPAELRSFVDWSAIKDSPLKLRVLGIALQDPQTALRIARRSERVIQSCVGLSPIRRAQAIRLVSLKQRDRTADPRIRIAACWLALALGSTDLPAWAQSSDYLADPKNKSVDRFGEFVALAASRSDPQQVAQLSLEPLLSMLETSTELNVLETLCGVLPRLAARLDRLQTRRAWQALIAIQEKPQGQTRLATPHALAAVVPRLEADQVTPIADGLIAALEKSKADQIDQVSDIWVALAPRLEPGQAERAANVLLLNLQRTKSRVVTYQSMRVLVALAPRLERAQVKHAADVLHAMMSSDDSWASEVFVALAPQLEPAQVRAAADESLSTIQEKSKQGKLDMASEILVALAPRLDPTRVARTTDAMFSMYKLSRDDRFRYKAAQVLVALAPRLDASRVKRAADALITTLETSSNDYERDATPAVLAALAPRLESAQAQRAGNVLIDILKKSEKNSIRASEYELARALAPRLTQSQADRSWDAVLSILEKSKYQNLALYVPVVAALAPRLQPAQATRPADTLTTLLETGARSLPDEELEAACEAFVELAPRLGPIPRDKLSLKAMESLLNDSSLFGPPFYHPDDSPHLRAILIARSISSPRMLARLLSHPACVDELGQALLHRFEELLFSDGKPKFGMAGDAYSLCEPEKPGSGQHRFHNLHDAAAWIQGNWPDFDLETNCRVTWRGSR